MEVIHLASPGGRSYVGELLEKELPVGVHKKFNKYVQMLKRYGLEPLRRAGYVVKLRGYELYELIVDYFRVLFVVRAEACYFLHVFKKKRNDTPIREIQTALNRARELDELLSGGSI